MVTERDGRSSFADGFLAGAIGLLSGALPIPGSLSSSEIHHNGLQEAKDI